MEVINNIAFYSQQFNELKVCVIVPTYNNAGTILQVVEGVLKYTQNIIVVNDGCTDETEKLLKTFSTISIVTHISNKGKGAALKSGFEKAMNLGFLYAITIDSDGQHFTTDLPLFIDALQKEGASLIMGARNLKQENVPGKSSFGNQFSNFWFKVETGITLPDTQTGYRLYPLLPISQMKLFSHKFELEIEVIVRLAWKGVKVCSIPITVYYPPKNKRISHFRPFKDFSRISVLNTILFTIAILYIHPRNFMFWLFKKRNWKHTLLHLFNNPHESNIKKSAAMGFGAFMGIVPIWGFQLIVAITVSHVLKLNKALVVLAAHISIPPILPLILWGSYELGKPWMGRKAVSLSFERTPTLESIKLNITQYIFGSITLAIIVGVLIAATTFIILSVVNKKKLKQTI